MNTGNEQHGLLLNETIRELEAEGWRVVDLKGKSPDAVAAKDGKLIAIEVLGQSWTKKGWKGNWTFRSKKANYSMFDDVLIKVFRRIPTDKNIPRYCEFKGCQSEDYQTEIVYDRPLMLCQDHSQVFLDEVNLESRTEMTYWAVDNLKRRASRKWLRWRGS